MFDRISHFETDLEQDGQWGPSYLRQTIERSMEDWLCQRIRAFDNGVVTAVKFKSDVKFEVTSQLTIAEVNLSL